MSMFGRIADIHRRTRKPNDILWNRLFARPLAAAALLLLSRTRVTPNQLTLSSLFVFVLAMGLMASQPGRGGLLVAVAVLQLSYVLDCTDGQLARLRAISTRVGAHLDFLMDELKALALVAGVSVRLSRFDDDPVWLLEGVLGAAVVGAGLSLTTFTRRPEYRAATGARVDLGAGDYGQGFTAPPPSPRRGPLWLVEKTGKLAIHYPSHILVFAILDRMDIFLHVYLLANAAHAGRTMLQVALRLGRALPPAPHATNPAEPPPTT